MCVCVYDVCMCVCVCECSLCFYMCILFHILSTGCICFMDFDILTADGDLIVAYWYILYYVCVWLCVFNFLYTNECQYFSMFV